MRQSDLFGDGRNYGQGSEVSRAAAVAYEPKRDSDAWRVLRALRHQPRTAEELIVCAGHRFGARIYDLRQKGYRIETRTKGTLTTYRLLDS